MAKTPPDLAAFNRRLITGLAVLVLAVSAGAALLQGQFEKAEFEFGTVRPCEGVMYQLPVPTLHTPKGEIILVGPGKHGIPETLLFALDREAQVRSPERAVLRPLCMAAAEMLDAFDANRWEKLAPGRSAPPRSNLRLLQLNEQQYVKVYERVAEYLVSARLDEERKRKAQVQLAVEASLGDQPDKPQEETPPQADDDLAGDIANLLKGGAPAEIRQPQNV